MSENKNGGALFKNDRKQKDTDPDYTGTFTLDGKEYYLAGWVNKSKTSDKTYLSIKPTLKTPASQATPSTPLSHVSTIADPVDDLPF